jgi:hypothetical protein
MTKTTISLILSFLSLQVFAFEVTETQVKTSLYTSHFTDRSKHNNHQHMLDIQIYEQEHFVGLSLFKNSFHQPTQYLYIGKRYHPFDGYPSVNAKLTAGIIHGYKGEYKDRIKFNMDGFAPAIIPSIGIEQGPLTVDLVFFGGAIITAGLKF